ncbi:MAG: hypothetical protein HC875_02890 [Anaerolineales bacterium]|nr:hypothetical protein [Anaerolineales bacterium]
MTATNQSSIDVSTRQKQLEELTQNLNILREREAKYGDNVPLELLHQIRDHYQAIDLIKRGLAGQLSAAELDEALKPLLLALPNGQVVNITAETYVAGNQTVSHVTFGDITGGIHKSIIAGRDVIIEQALTATEEALKAHEIASQRLAEGVIDYTRRLGERR